MAIVFKVNDDRFGGVFIVEEQIGPVVFLDFVHPKDFHPAIEGGVEEFPLFVSIDVGGDDVGHMVFDDAVSSGIFVRTKACRCRRWDTGPVVTFCCGHEPGASLGEDERALVFEVGVGATAIVNISDGEDFGGSIVVSISACNSPNREVRSRGPSPRATISIALQFV